MFSNLRTTITGLFRVVDKGSKASISLLDATTDVVEGGAVYAKAWRKRVVTDDHFDAREYRETAKMNSAMKSAESRTQILERLDGNARLKAEYKKTFDRISETDADLDAKLADI